MVFSPCKVKAKLLVFSYSAEGFVIASRHARIINHDAVMQFCSDSALDYIPATILFHAGTVTVSEYFDFHGVCPVNMKMPDTVRQRVLTVK